MSSEPATPAEDRTTVDPRHRIRRLDGIRGAAVLLVVVYHAGYLTAGWGPRLLPGGFVGVDLFFVLSGYLITGLLLQELDGTGGIRVGKFMDRRMRRLYPALLAFTAATAVLLVRVGGVGDGVGQLPGRDLVRSVVATLLYLSNYAQASGRPFPAELSHTWSLAIEAQFYLAWPLLLMLLRAVRAPKAAHAVAVVVAMVGVALHRAAMWTDQAHYLPLYLRTDTRIDVVLAGCLLAMAVHWGWLTSARWLRVPALAGVGVIVVASLFSETGDVRMYRGFGLTAVAVAGLAIVASVLLDPDGPVGRVCGWRPLILLGDRSYSLYLWHVPVFLTIAKHIGDQPVAWRVACGLVVAGALTELSYRLVEPALRRRLGAARRTGPAATTTLTERFGAWTRRNRRIVLAAVAVIGAAPMAVAVVALSRFTWHPIGDLAQAMLRQLSFWHDPPLVGPAGRIGTFARQGNHPGPAMFWFTWPLWRLLGRSAWAYQASVAALVVASYAAAVLVARRAQGWMVALSVAVVGAVLMRSYGATALTQPWNPYVPLIPFLLFVVTCWAVARRRWAFLPLAVLAGSFCVQCHVGYAPTVAVGIAVAMVLALLPDPRRALSSSWRPVLAWTGVAVVVGAAMWTPPVIDQVRHDPGNFSILLQTYRDQTADVIGFRSGTRIWLTQLDPFGNWLFGTRSISTSPLPGALLLVAWAGSVVVAWRHRIGALLRLDIVLAGQLACAWFWAIRLDSERFLYLVEWFWVLTGLLVFATAWAARSVALRRGWSVGSPATAVAVAVTVLAASTVSFTWSAVGVSPPDMRYSRTVGALAPPVAAALDRSDTYLMTWVDPDALGGNGFGLMLELERRGFHVGAGPSRSAPVEPHRVLEAGQYDAVLTVVSGAAQIAAARKIPGAKELAYDDHRDAAQRAEYDRLRTEVIAELRAQGLDEVAEGIHASIWIGLNDPRVTGAPFDKLARMLQIGQATAVFESKQELVGL